MKVTEVAAGLLVADGKVLVCQRPEGSHYGLWWEFPGGKLEPGETPEQALVRELEEELSITVAPGPLLVTSEHTYDDGTTWKVHFFACTQSDQRSLTPTEAAQVDWTIPSGLGSYRFLEGNMMVLDELRSGLELFMQQS